MKNIRIGNDILFIWAIRYSDGTLIDLSAMDVTIYLITPVKRIQLHDFVIQDGKINWRFFGKDQEQHGEYSMTLVVNQGNEQMLTVDALGIFRLLSYIDASTLMINQKQSYTIEQETMTNITPISPIIPVIGKNGTWVISGKDTGVKAVAVDGESAFEIWLSMDGNENKTEADFMEWVRQPSKEAISEVKNTLDEQAGQIKEMNGVITTIADRDIIISESEFKALNSLDENKMYYVYKDK